MRNTRLNCVDSCIASSGITEHQSVRKIFTEPETAGLGHYLGKTLFGFQKSILAQSSKASGMEEQIAVKVACGIEGNAVAAGGFNDREGFVSV